MLWRKSSTLNEAVVHTQEGLNREFTCHFEWFCYRFVLQFHEGIIEVSRWDVFRTARDLYTRVTYFTASCTPRYDSFRICFLRRMQAPHFMTWLVMIAAVSNSYVTGEACLCQNPRKYICPQCRVKTGRYIKRSSHNRLCGSPCWRSPKKADLWLANYWKKQNVLYVAPEQDQKLGALPTDVFRA